MSITLHAATQARRLLALTAAGLPSRSESHPMDHDSNSSGHTKSKGATPDDLASYQPREVFAISDNPYGQNRRTPLAVFPLETAGCKPPHGRCFRAAQRRPSSRLINGAVFNGCMKRGPDAPSDRERPVL